MSGTKIIVFQLKELIKTVVFAIVGLLLIVALVYFFFPKKDKQDNGADPGVEEVLYIPGTYSSKVVLDNSHPFEVVVTVTENEITDITLSDTNETLIAFYPLIKPTFDTLSLEIMENQNLNVSISEENKETVQLLLSAVEDALIVAQHSPDSIQD